MNVTSATNTIRILKIEACLALKGNSTLTYYIGCNSKSEILLRIINNTNRGIFNKEWIKLIQYLKPLISIPAVSQLNRQRWLPYFRVRSTNSPGFLLAVLRNKGLVSQLQGKPHYFERMNPEKFMAEIDKIIQSGVNLRVNEIKR